MITTELNGVEVKIDDDGDVTVRPIFSNVDRNDRRYSCGKNQQLANRLCQAIKDGKIITNAVIETDIYEKTYVSYDFNIRMRCANADLRKLGY